MRASSRQLSLSNKQTDSRIVPLMSIFGDVPVVLAAIGASPLISASLGAVLFDSIRPLQDMK